MTPSKFLARRIAPGASIASAVALAIASCAAPPAQRGSTGAPAPVASTTAATAATPVIDARPTRVWWGDEHVHSGWSGDAGLAGTILSPEDAVRFVRGEERTRELR